MKERKPGRHYFVINIDEPYAEQVYAAMKNGEIEKRTWPEGDISFDEWKKLNFAGMPTGEEQRLKERMISEIRGLADTLPEEAREAYLLCIEMEDLEQRIIDVSYESARALVAKARSIHATLKESVKIISSEKRFGTFLIEEGLATPEQIVAALDMQNNSAKSIEKIACEQKMLTHEQILDIFNAHSEISKMFGEIARELGYLNDEQVKELISIQMKDRPPVGELLIHMGVLDTKTLQASLDKFLAQKEQSAKTA